MLTIAETRRARLEQLISRYNDKLADLNEALHYERNDTRLARIRNANERKDRPGKIFQMGDAQAREIEDLLGLERGWMDTPPGYDDFAVSEKLQRLHHVAEELAPYQVDHLIAIAATFSNPDKVEDASIKAETQTGGHGSDDRRGLSPVKPAAPKNIGAGHFGPPAEGHKEKGSRSGQSRQSGKGVRAGNARGRG